MTEKRRASQSRRKDVVAGAPDADDERPTDQMPELVAAIEKLTQRRHAAVRSDGEMYWRLRPFGGRRG